MKELHSYRKTVSVTAGKTLTLNHIPDSCQRVYIKGYKETRKEVIQSNEYYVDYNTGIITFGSGIVGKEITIVYYSREVQ